MSVGFGSRMLEPIDQRSPSHRVSTWLVQFTPKKKAPCCKIPRIAMHFDGYRPQISSLCYSSLCWCIIFVSHVGFSSIMAIVQLYTWRSAFWNGGTPQSTFFLLGFSVISHPLWGTAIYLLVLSREILGMIRNNYEFHPSNPQQPIHSLRLAQVSNSSDDNDSNDSGNV